MAKDLGDDRQVAIMMAGNPHLEQEWLRWGEPLASASIVVYAVHGRGGSPEDMADVLKRIAVPGIHAVLPAAADHTWYPQGFLAPFDANQPALDNALATVEAHRARLEGEGVSPGRLALLGFSQGACLLAEHLLRTRRRCAGAVILTGGYIGPDAHPWPEDLGLVGMPVLMTTARDDEWVPLARFEETVTAFRSVGAQVESHVDDDPFHQVNDDMLLEAHRFLGGLAGR
jgi:phospholipase/carboxylesterase